MTIDPHHKADFEDYEAPLQHLEEAFNKTGLQIEFVGMVTASGEKYIHILENGRTNAKQSIECDSPGQAIKDVARAVRL